MDDPLRATDATFAPGVTFQDDGTRRAEPGGATDTDGCSADQLCPCSGS